MVTRKRTGKVLGSIATLTLSLAVPACTGQIIEPSGKGGPEGADGPGSDAKGTDPGRKAMHRLNRAEYNATVQDVLGTALAPATELWRGGENHGFDNIAEVLGIDDLQYQRYFEAAAALAEDVFATPPARDRVVSCTTADDLACVRSIIGATGLRVFRRPLDAEEVGTYQRVYERARQLGENHEGSLEQVVRALLASAEFLYRIETDPDPSSATPHPVAPYELVARLSYFLWSSAPDDALLSAAADGTIGDAAKVPAIVDRMLDDPKSDRFVRNFVGQWLGARRVSAHAVSPELFPEWSPALASAMAEEMYQYFFEFLRTDGSWLEFLKSDVNFVDGDLARLYGMSAPGQGMARVEVTDDGRAGFLGLGGFLALTSYEYRTAPTLRGRWILINLLCSPPRDPPPGIPALDDATGSAEASEQNVRVRLEEHRTNPVCSGCHAAMDPYGIALENFDAIGKFRSAYRNGSAIDVSTALPNGTAFEGLAGMSDVVAAHPKFTACVTEKLFTFALGRGVERTDRPYLTQIEQEWRREKPTLRSLIKSLVTADTFRLRRPEAIQ
jgi:hypothetical protein